MTISTRFATACGVMQRIACLDGLPPLLFRIFLSPIMIQAGYAKLANFDDTANWFGNPEWGLGLPFPELSVALAGGTELVGGIMLLLGLGTRLVAIPLMLTMLVAAVTAHWHNGWHALPETSLTVPWEWRMDLIEGANERKAMAIEILKEYGNYAWLTETGAFTVLKNGIEFAATYFLMLLSLFFTGGGRYTSVDHYLCAWWCKRHNLA